MKKKIAGFWHDFTEFALKGNVISLATGIIIGGAFSKITSSLVGDIVMPVISLVTGKIDFANMFITLDGNKYQTLDIAKENTSVIAYGSFLTVILDFLIMAVLIFLITKWITIIVNKTAPKAEAAPTTKECKFCRTKIHIKAIRCPQCTSEVES